MSIHPKLKPFLYGLGVFSIFMSLSVLMKLISHRIYTDAEYFGVISNKDLMLGLIIALLFHLHMNKGKNLNRILTIKNRKNLHKNDRDN